MVKLKQANRELFARPEDERFETLADLHQHCQTMKERSVRLKTAATEFRPTTDLGDLALRINGHEPHRMNDWSFSQLCGIAGVAKETINRLRPETAAGVLAE